MNIKVSTENKVITIAIDRVEKKNALTVPMYAAMADALVAANVDEKIRAVLITGRPEIFTAGNEMGDFLAAAAGTDGTENTAARAFMHALIDCEKPVVAAVNGAAIGIGTTLLLHCDLVYLAEDAKLVMPFVNLGLVPEFAASRILPQRIGPINAARHLLLGEPITAQEAVAMGLANAVLPAPDVLAHARRVAERFNALPPKAVRETKKLMRASGAQTLREIINIELNIFGECLRGPEAKEAIEAFMQKRKADFSRF
jgi:enoyl-CoA hydratase/carnithine racemase